MIVPILFPLIIPENKSCTHHPDSHKAKIIEFEKMIEDDRAEEVFHMEGLTEYDTEEEVEHSSLC